jgi:ArsR family transcriptional regulator, arsenate/arsenite/antimonite-responsive transcriptional repressor
LIDIDELDEVKALARLFKALADETRLRLLKLLSEQEGESALCVGALATRLGVSQSAVSQHLAVLRAAGLVSDERRGYFVHYRVNRAGLGRWHDQLRTVLGEDFGQALVG